MTRTLKKHETPVDAGMTKPTIFQPEGGWKENSYYIVDVAHSPHNPVFRSILYTGFLNGWKTPQGTQPGGYHKIWNAIAEQCEIQELYYMAPVFELADDNLNPKVDTVLRVEEVELPKRAYR